MDFSAPAVVAIPAAIITVLVVRGLVVVAMMAWSFIFWTVKAIRGHEDLQ